jgi:hypothetical protein
MHSAILTKQGAAFDSDGGPFASELIPASPLVVGAALTRHPIWPRASIPHRFPAPQSLLFARVALTAS